MPASSASSAASYAAAHATPLNPVAHRLGMIGLVPFVVGVLFVLLVHGDALPAVQRMMANYAVAVVSFLGAIHWGLGMRASIPSPTPFVWGVIPALIAAVAAIMSPDAVLVIQGLMLIICYLVDRKVYPAHGLSHWLTLRFRLTVVSALSCFVGALRI